MKLIHEIASGGLGGLLSVVNLRGKEVNGDLQLVAEMAHFFVLCLKVFPLRMGEDKVEYSDAPLDVFDLVFPAIAKVLPANLTV
ncbi:MAG: hypothetical protein DMG43_11780 [Acidobacteria bacterium]|nr:MAG: hypothetical protein DMG43_11780 [Acidobacteriota bacterium]